MPWAEKRLKEFEEGIRTIRMLLQGGVLETPTSRVRVNYRLVPTPVYLSMEGPRGLRLAGRVADGVFLGSGVEPRAVYEETVEALAREVMPEFRG